MIPPEFLARLESVLPVSDVVGRFVKLQRAGAEYKACCPFHKETTPSFTVNNDKGFYHCFGCGAHGGIVKFVMEHQRLDFFEAVSYLADWAGLEVPHIGYQQREAWQAQQSQQKRLYQLLELACSHMQDLLQSQKGHAARQYLQHRHVTEESIRHFRLGYADHEGETLYKKCRDQGFTAQELVSAGLFKKRDQQDKLYPFFRNRLLFPVMDLRGRVVGFGARLMEGQAGPKYLNSPQTEIFNKGELVYHLHQFRRTPADDILVVEGYMDVISLHQAGFSAVAPLGTALTAGQITAIWQTHRHPILCFDGDSPGRSAAHRATSRFLPLLKPGYSCSLVYLPDGEDPDSLLEKRGASAMTSCMKAARPLYQDIIFQEISAFDLQKPEERAGAQQALRNRIGEIENQTVAREYHEEIKHFWRREKQNRYEKERDIKGRYGYSGGYSGQGKPPDRIGLARLLPHLPIHQNRGRREIAISLLSILWHYPALFDEVCEQATQLTIADEDWQKFMQLFFTRLHEQESLQFSDNYGSLARFFMDFQPQDIVNTVIQGKIKSAVPSRNPKSFSPENLEEAGREWQSLWKLWETQTMQDDVRKAQEQGDWEKVQALSQALMREQDKL